MSGIRVVASDISAEFRSAVSHMSVPIANACTKAIILAGSNLQTKGRADIAGAGFGAKWQNTWKAKLYQVSPPSIDAAAWNYHIIPYSRIFQDGGQIHGKPYLWLPLRSTPKAPGGGRITPKKAYALGYHMFPIERAGKPPLLATKVYAARHGRAARGRVNFNLSRTKIRKSQKIPANIGNLVRVTVPLFFALTLVTIRKRFHLDEIATAEAANLETYYLNNLNVDD